MSDDLPAVAALLSEFPVCADCLATKTGLVRWQVDEVIRRLGESIRTAPTVSACRYCRKLTVVYTLA